MATQVSLNSGAVASAGALALQTNGTTEAVSISTGQVATLAQNPILTSGTANGVAYLNGSKAVTSGTALVFDGTNLGVGVTPSAWNGLKSIQVYDTTSAALSGSGYAGYVSTNCYYSAGTWYRVGASYGSNLYSQFNGAHQWYSAGTGTAGSAITFTQAMTLDASGNLLVGSTTSISKVNIGASFGSSYPSYSNPSSGGFNGGFFSSANNSSDGYRTMLDIGAVTANTDGTSGGSAVRFLTQPRTSPYALVEAARIDSSGNLLVGTTSSFSARLSVKDSTSNGTTYPIYCKNSSDTILFYISSNGYFVTGVGANSPYNLTTASAANVTIESDGVLKRSTSSLKYKTDVQDATHGLAEVLSLRPVTYKGKNDGETIFGGLIAEEVDAAGLTEFVQYAEDGTPDALAYGNMVSLCIKAIQEQQAIIQSLTDRITALESA